MSRRNMSERAMGGLMLCEGVNSLGAAPTVALATPGTDRVGFLKILKEIFPPKNSEISETEKTAREKSLTDLDNQLFAYKNGIGPTPSEDGQSTNKALENLTNTLGELLKKSGVETREATEKVVNQIAGKYNLTAEQKQEIMASLDAQKKLAQQKPDSFLTASNIPLNNSSPVLANAATNKAWSQIAEPSA